MILGIDIGNTNIVFGIFEKEKILNSFRLSTDRGKTADEYGVFLKSFFDSAGVPLKNGKTDLISGVIISSVVPPLSPIFKKVSLKMFDKEPVFVGINSTTGLIFKIDKPDELGADRIVNAAGAYKKYGGPLIVIDFGTATTFCAITSGGVYLGGVIAPGILIQSEALFLKTAKLPRIELEKTEKVIGKNTVKSMQSGILWGNFCLVSGLVEKIKEEINETNIKVILTGGLGHLIYELSKKDWLYDPFLTLEGLRVLYEMNKK